MLGGDPGASVSVPLVEAGAFDQPGGGRLDPPVRLGPPRWVPGDRRPRLVAEDRVGEERAGADRVRVARVDDHALAAAQAQHGFAHLGERRDPTHRHVQRAAQLGVGERAGALGLAQPEADGEHGPAVVVLEHAVAVLERALRRAHRAHGVRLTVVRADPRDRLRDVLPVRADVLDRRRARGAGDAGQALDARQAVLDGSTRRPRPTAPRRRTTSTSPVERDPARAHEHDRAREVLVGEHDVRAAGQQRASAGPVRRRRARLRSRR